MVNFKALTSLVKVRCKRPLIMDPHLSTVATGGKPGSGAPPPPYDSLCPLISVYSEYVFETSRYENTTKSNGKEKPRQFIVRLKNYLTKWVKLAKVEESFDGVVELVVREQFSNACPKELSVYLNEKEPKNFR